MAPTPMPVQSNGGSASGGASGGQVKQSSSSMSSFMCCTSERSGKTYSYREQSAMTTSSQQNQSKFLWLDPTRWVEKKTVKKEKVGKEKEEVDESHDKSILRDVFC